MAGIERLAAEERASEEERLERESRFREEQGIDVGLQSVDGLLVWGSPVDDFSLRFRKLKKQITISFHLFLIILSAFTLAALVWHIVRLDALDDALTLPFWTSGSWEITVFWLGVFLDTFIIFRLSEYSQDTRVLPNWGKSRRQQESYEAAAEGRRNHRFDISAYFSDEGWEVIGGAYRLAKNLHRRDIGIIHLFAAALSSRVGSVFLTRVGLPFDKVKEPLARLVNSGESGSGSAPPLSRDAKKMLLLAYEDARAAKRKHVGVIELFLNAYAADERLREMFDELGFPPSHVIHVAEWVRLREKLREEHERFVMLARLKPAGAMNRAMTARATPLLDRFSEDLTVSARSGYLPPLINREKEMNDLLRAVESGRRSVILVGDRGVGKQAIVEGLARRMVEEDVPQELFDRRLVSVSLPQVIAAGDPSLASERFYAMLQEVSLSGNIILVLYGIEALTGGSGQGPLDLAEGLATELDRGRFIVIGSTTPQNYTQYIERRSLGGKLIRVDVPEMNADQSVRVLMAKCGAIEYQNNVFFTFAAIERAVTLSGRFLHDHALPEKALDIIRETAVLARKKRGEQSFVTAEDVASIIHDKTNIPVESVSEDETQKLLHLEDRLHGRVIGQDAAVTAVAQAMRRARAELREGKRPIANFLFLGPTGVGKTETAKSLAAEYFGREDNMVRLDMSEYQDAGSVNRMIGAPGDERGGFLTEAVRRNPFSIVLLDEIEKAHPDILNLFLQVMDDGRLTDGVGRTVDFTNVVLIATSNAGTQFIQDEVQKGTDTSQIRMMLLERELKGIFRPEFLNRFDSIIVFTPLTPDDVERIAWLLLKKIEARLAERGILFRADDAAVEALARSGYDPLFGARPLRRVMQDRVENQLADLILRGSVSRRDTIALGADGTLTVEKAAPIA